MITKKKNLIFILFLILIFSMIFLTTMNFEHQIVTKENKFAIAKITKITFYNGNEKLVLDQEDEEFSKIISVFENKSLKTNNSVHMGYKNYKIRLSNAFNYVDIFPEFANDENDFAQVGKESRFTGSYNYININKKDNKVLFDCYKDKTGNPWTLSKSEQ